MAMPKDTFKCTGCAEPISLSVHEMYVYAYVLSRAEVHMHVQLRGIPSIDNSQHCTVQRMQSNTYINIADHVATAEACLELVDVGRLNVYMGRTLQR